MGRKKEAWLFWGVLLVFAVFLGTICIYNLNKDRPNAFKQDSSSMKAKSGPQTLILHTGPDQNGNKQGKQSSNSVKTAPTTQGTKHNAGLSKYLPPEYSSTPQPDFDDGRPAPTLNVPPSPSCGSSSDSSYYANCMDGYCRTYPDTPVCLNNH